MTISYSASYPGGANGSMQYNDSGRFNGATNVMWNKEANCVEVNGVPMAPQVKSDWSSSSGMSEILNKPSLATVAMTGSYSDLSGKPVIPTSQINTDWNSISGLSQLLNKPSLATVASTGAYSDLSGKPSIPSAQVQADWAQTSSGSIDFVKNKSKFYLGSSLRVSPVHYSNTATTTAGAVVFTLTETGSIGGAALFSNIDYVKAEVNDATNSYNYSYLISADKKTVTVSVMRSAPTGVIALLGINLLSAPIATPNGTAVNIIVHGS